MSPAPPALSGTDRRRARLAVSLAFIAHGVVAGSFASRVAWTKEHLGIGAGTFGAALVFQALGALLAMSTTSRLIHRFGERASLRVSLVVWCAVIPLPALMPNAVTLAAAMFAMGMVSGTSMVTTNAQAVLVERAVGRSVMTGLHGLWSVGSLAGAGLGTLATFAAIAAPAHLAVVALAAAPVAYAATTMLPDLDSPAVPGVTAPKRFALPEKAVVAVGLVGFCSSFIEGTGHNWTVVYLEQSTRAAPAVATLGYTAFVAAMAAARLLGDLAVRRFGAARTVRAGASTAACGAVLAVLATSPPYAVAGFVLIGVGVAVTIPLAAAAGGRLGSSPARGVAGVMAITSTAGLAAPAVVGGVADLTSIRVSFAVIALVAATMAVLSKALRGDAPAPAPAPRPELAKAA